MSVSVQVEEPEKFTFVEINEEIQTTYNYPNQNHSAILDIIAMYLKGQKILYTEAKSVCEQRLNALMLPAIFITALCTILSLLFKDQTYGPTIVSCLNGGNAFILALINYIKLDAKAEAHRISAYKFDKLQSSLEFSSGKVLFIKDQNDVGNIIKQTETNVRDIKETNQFILPESIRYDFPTLYNMNVFAEVKKIQNKEMIKINQLKDVINQLKLLKIRNPRPQEDIEECELKIKFILTEVIKLKDEYLSIDNTFETEMKKYRDRASRRRNFCCDWLKS
ncbi:MAG: hypothetical protein EBU01_09600 [Crocinitomicaceae bacterium]|nr:hypothetical protein [Crocinitomicaceae bacterium]